MSENRYTTKKYFNPINPKTSRIKDKRINVSQLIYKLYFTLPAADGNGKFTVHCIAV